MAENLWEFIDQALTRYAERTAWVRRLPKGQRQTYSYGQIRASALRIYDELLEHGVGRGDCISILAVNGPEWGAAAFAAWKLGAVVAPLHTGNSDEELKAQAIALQPKLILFHDGDRGLDNTVPIRLQEHIENAASAPQPEKTAVDRHDEAVRILTSGSTGSPKIVRLSHDNIMSNVLGAQRIDVNVAPDDRFLSLLPLSHAMELTGGMMLPLTSGASIVLPKVLAANEIMAALEEEQITVMVAVPRLYRNIMLGLEKRFAGAGAGLRAFVALVRAVPLPLKKILNAPLRRRLGGSIKCWLSGGSRLDPTIGVYFRSLGLPLRQGYGLTECSPVVSVQGAWEPLVESVGEPLPGVEVRLHEPDDAGTGELWVRGPNVMLGYVDEAQTAEVMRDGWYATGDLARLVDGNKIVLTGRRKRLIVTEAGKNVYPEDLEGMLERDPELKEAGVVEVDMRPAAVLAIDPPDELETARKIIKRFNARVSSHNRISRYAVVNELPRTPLGKVSLKDLPNIFAEYEVKKS